jgi:thiamine biosynthesis protein ThiC
VENLIFLVVLILHECTEKKKVEKIATNENVTEQKRIDPLAMGRLLIYKNWNWQSIKNTMTGLAQTLRRCNCLQKINASGDG